MSNFLINEYTNTATTQEVSATVKPIPSEFEKGILKGFRLAKDAECRAFALANADIENAKLDDILDALRFAKKLTKKAYRRLNEAEAEVEYYSSVSQNLQHFADIVQRRDNENAKKALTNALP